MKDARRIYSDPSALQQHVDDIMMHPARGRGMTVDKAIVDEVIFGQMELPFGEITRQGHITSTGHATLVTRISPVEWACSQCEQGWPPVDPEIGEIRKRILSGNVRTVVIHDNFEFGVK